MKKTGRKKLTLNKTTLRTLGTDGLKRAAGGDSDWGCTASCNCSEIFCPTKYTCGTCDVLCAVAEDHTIYINPANKQWKQR